jgi:hypothetical protein
MPGLHHHDVAKVLAPALTLSHGLYCTYSENIQNIIFDFFTVKVNRIGVATRARTLEAKLFMLGQHQRDAALVLAPIPTSLPWPI